MLLSLKKIMAEKVTTYKHMRGRHDQRDHAWNRGMGRGGYTSADGSVTTAQVTEEEYKDTRKRLFEDVRNGLITRQKMREELRKLQVQTPSRRETAAGKIQQGREIQKIPNTLRRDAPTEYMPNPVSLEELNPGGQVHTAMLKAYNQFRVDNPDFALPEVPDNVPFGVLVNRMDKRVAQSALYEVLGYNGKPEVRQWDDMSNLENVHEFHRNGALYRGVRSISEKDLQNPSGFAGDIMDKQLTGQEIMDDFRTGEKHFVGFGIMGYGTYTSTDIALVSQHGDNIVQIALQPDAVAFIPEAIYQMSRVEYEAIARYGRIDLGLLMALAGYDAYVTMGGRDEPRTNINILNRGKSIVSRETANTAAADPYGRGAIPYSYERKKMALSKSDMEALMPGVVFVQ